MNEENIHEMFQHLFDTEIFSIEEDHDEVTSFCLAQKVADRIKLLVLLKDEMNEKLSAPDIELLNKIADFKEYHLTRAEVAVINLAYQTVSLKQLMKKFPVSNIVCFGIYPAEIGLQIDSRSNQLMHFRGVNFIFTSALRQISKDEKLKKQFFIEALKPMFSSSNKNQK